VLAACGYRAGIIDPACVTPKAEAAEPTPDTPAASAPGPLALGAA
jgi:hypothetical protein